MTNINPLLSNCYNFTIGKGDEKLSLFGQNISVPGLALNVQPQPTTLGIQIPVAVNTFNFDPLSLSFIVDENLENWLSIYNWMKSIGNIENDTDNVGYREWTTQARLDILKSSYLKSNTSFLFSCVTPVALSALNFRSDISDTNPVVAKVSFQYSYYKPI